jgi:[ribosomal protein S18]-alanine N-acetyltransferase
VIHMEYRVQNDKITLRPAASSDVRNISILEERIFPTPWSEESIRHDIEHNENALVAVAEWNGNFAGYLDVWQVVGEGQVNNFGVLPEFRDKGIGSQLMQYMMEWLLENGNLEISLEVRVSNEGAIRLYHRMGFRELGVRKNYYLDTGEDALLMSKSLKEENL